VSAVTAPVRRSVIVSGLGNDGANAATSELIVIRGDAVAERPLAYSWKPYLPKNKLVHIGGNSGQAKSPVTIDLAARFTSGTPWPDGTPNHLGPRSVVLLNVEDDLEDTIVPRFRLAGGDKTKLHYVKGTRIRRGAEATERGVMLTADMEQLTKLARSLPDLALMVIDPITNYLGGGVKMNAEEQVRALLTPLAALAAELSITIITIGHFNRRERGTTPLHRMMGAAAFTGVARAVYACGRQVFQLVPAANDQRESAMRHHGRLTRFVFGRDTRLSVNLSNSQKDNIYRGFLWAGLHTDSLTGPSARCQPGLHSKAVP
jgi:hypothetical protein